jgi:hypothetical protein
MSNIVLEPSPHCSKAEQSTVWQQGWYVTANVLVVFITTNMFYSVLLPCVLRNEGCIPNMFGYWDPLSKMKGKIGETPNYAS